ncbi:MAG: hypothetical protein IJY43_06295 [Clostridia bacterium]|nr:hypothetical protein [Clostridia bacterium]
MDSYKDILKIELIKMSVVSIILLILFIAVVILLIKFKFDKLIGAVLIVALAGGLIFAGFSVTEFVLDFQNNSFVVYEGEFEGQKLESFSAGITLCDENKTKLTTTVKSFNVPQGKYFGYVIYSERSRILLDLDFEE